MIVGNIIHTSKTPVSVKNVAKYFISAYTIFHRKALILEKNCTKNMEKPLMPTYIVLNRRRFIFNKALSAITVKKMFQKIEAFKVKKNIYSEDSHYEYKGGSSAFTCVTDLIAHIL